MTLIDSYDTLLLDLDGVCYLGKEAVVHAPQSLSLAASKGVKQAFVTNNASRPPQAVSDQLTELGIPALPAEVVTAAQVGAQLLSEHVPAGSKVLILGTQALVDEVEARGYSVVVNADDDPAAVIQGFKPSLTWEDMSEVALAIRKGALYIATNLDKTIPRERGLMVGNGSIAAAITNSTGVSPLSAGKPEPEIFHVAAKFMDSKKPLAVGDNLDTDIQGAVSAGYDVLHVLTGLATARDICLAPPAQRPTYLADDLRVLHEDYPIVTFDSEQARCGAAVVSWDGTGFTVHIGDDAVMLTEGVRLELDAYRALAALAWQLADQGTDHSELEAALPVLTVSREN